MYKKEEKYKVSGINVSVGGNSFLDSLKGYFLLLVTRVGVV